MRILEDELKLVEQARGGNLRAFHTLYEAYAAPLYAFILRMTRSREDAEDLLQNTFVKAYRNLSRFRGDSHFSTWLFSIAKNETVSFLRQHKRRNGKELSLNDVSTPALSLPDDEDPEVDVLNSETEAVLHQAVSHLPEKYRAAFLLGVVEGLPYEEVGKILKCTVPNVKSRIFRARAKLAKWLRKHYPEFAALVPERSKKQEA
ncbi:MAG: sigma-70 family RNA polymerase sigma factor [Calditrichaeota bacterium]|nr:sigma-70 family RNA polymerase sigma factor [Calditrichota bacterium]